MTVREPEIAPSGTWAPAPAGPRSFPFVCRSCAARWLPGWYEQKRWTVLLRLRRGCAVSGEAEAE
ncbi:hypothetical protein trd_A0269 (plasmid) [Thermomicrobium roseum DSM 5159]|uniref:Uncharacterized protein n=1 Tax=Thermomicrobium roseum (strain ATCC 27502 / DSM 5159 / P-2) TaxID=309801 RepID=B9L3A5_THERP|nr:hypothetical protein trd_A0269 [Thermomicrobium roseum DSM 5159]